MKALSIFFALILMAVPALAQDAPESAWAVRCEKDAKGKPKACEMFQRLVDMDTGMRMAEFAIGRPDGRDTALGAVVLPLGILLQPGAEMHIDDTQSFAFNIRYCSTAGCHAFIDLNSGIVALLQSGSQAVFTFQLQDGSKAELPMSLAGFSTAYASIK